MTPPPRRVALREPSRWDTCTLPGHPFMSYKWAVPLGPPTHYAQEPRHGKTQGGRGGRQASPRRTGLCHTCPCLGSESGGSSTPDPRPPCSLLLCLQPLVSSLLETLSLSLPSAKEAVQEGATVPSRYLWASHCPPRPQPVFRPHVFPLLRGRGRLPQGLRMAVPLRERPPALPCGEAFLTTPPACPTLPRCLLSPRPYGSRALWPLPVRV